MSQFKCVIIYEKGDSDSHGRIFAARIKHYIHVNQKETYCHKYKCDQKAKSQHLAKWASMKQLLTVIVLSFGNHRCFLEHSQQFCQTSSTSS